MTPFYDWLETKDPELYEGILPFLKSTAKNVSTALAIGSSFIGTGVPDNNHKLKQDYNQQARYMARRSRDNNKLAGDQAKRRNYVGSNDTGLPNY